MQNGDRVMLKDLLKLYLYISSKELRISLPLNTMQKHRLSSLYVNSHNMERLFGPVLSIYSIQRKL